MGLTASSRVPFPLSQLTQLNAYGIEDRERDRGRILFDSFDSIFFVFFDFIDSFDCI